MNEKNNYGKIIAIAVAVVAATSAIAYVIYRLTRKLVAFCVDYSENPDPELPDEDELDEELDPNMFFELEDEEAAVE